MDGDNDGAKAQGAAQVGAQDEGGQAAQTQVTGGGAGAGDGARAREEFEAALTGRDARIAELEGEIAESAEKLRAEMDELRRQGDEQRIGFELQMAGCRSVKEARALLDDHGGDVAALKEAEPWLFEGSAPKQAGKTGLPNAGAASDEGKTMKRWREIAGHASVAPAEEDFSDAEAEDVLVSLRAATNERDEAEVTAGSCIRFITPTFKGVLDDFSLASPNRSKALLTRFSRVVEVPRTRFFLAITLNSGDEDQFGYSRAEGSHIKTTDSSIVPGKTYYTESSGTYSKVSSPGAAGCGPGLAFTFK